ncbi:hypothetical protein JQC93_01365 [Vibrio sp. 188UL20-2]|uniref:Lipoprotein n=2 Tax=Vibrio ulleungensis TaxID=2807619 RepID=A0ABS2HG55_9VIBR|nr:hypothetical protein [Vibrio ulleungensis]
MVVLLSFGCGTSDTALREGGHGDSYIMGFHDGRHSGMQETGNHYEQFIKDEQRFATDQEYQQGWLAGEAEGKKLQSQAATVGQGLASGYSAHSATQSTDDVAKEAVKGVDTSGLEALE